MTSVNNDYLKAFQTMKFWKTAPYMVLTISINTVTEDLARPHPPESTGIFLICMPWTASLTSPQELPKPN